MQLHEVLSYGDIGNGRYDISSVKEMFKNWSLSFKNNGRMILRDFCRPSTRKDGSSNQIKIRFKNKETLEYAILFFQDWEKRRASEPNRHLLTYERVGEDSILCSEETCMELIISMKHPLT